jgi:hypothetical protein
MEMKRYLCLVVALLLLLFAGCSASSPDNSYDGVTSEAPAAPMPEPDSVSGSGSYGEAGYDKAKTATTQTALPDYGGHKVIRTFSVSIETDAFDSDFNAITKSALDLGGYVQNSQVNGRKPEVYSDPGRYANLTLRIPADKADEFMEGVKGYGTLISANEQAEDVTDAYFDLETRLEVLHTQLERLKSILVTTDNLADIITLEKEIADVTLQIEQLTTEVRRYDGLISYATVTLSIEELRLNEGPAAEQTVWERIDRGFTDTLYGVGTFFVNLFVILVSALPVLVVFGVIALIVILCVRGSRKRKKKKEEKPIQAFVSNKEENKNDK